ncbi:MAG: DUF1641 domain-containing protein [Vicinamibacterales bacterium]
MTMSAAGVATPQDRLQARLSDPATVDSLNRLLDRVDLMAFMLDAVDGFLRRGDTVVDSVSAGVREISESVGIEDGAELLAKLPKLARSGAEIADVASGPAFDNLLHSGLLERLGDPRTIQLLQTLVERLETAVFLLDAVDGFLRRGDEIAESASAIVGELRHTSIGVDVDQVRALAERAPRVLDALGELTDSRTLDRVPDMVNAVGVLAEAGILDPKVVGVLGEVGHKLASAYQAEAKGPIKPLGAMGLVRALGEPEVQRAMGLLVAVARRFGRELH